MVQKPNDVVDLVLFGQIGELRKHVPKIDDESRLCTLVTEIPHPLADCTYCLPECGDPFFSKFRLYLLWPE